MIPMTPVDPGSVPGDSPCGWTKAGCGGPVGYRSAAVGLTVPGDLSVIVLGDDIGARDPSISWTRLSVPGIERGAAATRLLAGLLDGSVTGSTQQSVACVLEDGSTLAAPPGSPW